MKRNNALGELRIVGKRPAGAAASKHVLTSLLPLHGEKLFDALEMLYNIIAEPIKPENLETWQDDTWNRLKGKSDEEIENYIQVIKDIASM